MISGFSQVALAELQSALGGGGGSTTIVIDFDRLASEVQRLVSVAERIAETAANPTFAAGDEMCRRAATALEHGWYEDAVADARRSVEAYPYRGAPHLLEAVALLHLGRTVEAFESLRSCIRYGEAAEPQHAATASLLAASLAYGAGKPEQAHELLTAGYTATGRRCPALLVALINDHLLTPDVPLAVSLLRDDPRSWVGVDVRDEFFGGEGRRIADAFSQLVDELRSLVAAAEQFSREVSKWSARDLTFYDEMFDSGSRRYFADGYQRYADGGSASMLRRFVDSLEPVGGEHLSMRMLVGFDIIRTLGFRANSAEPMPDGVREWHVDVEGSVSMAIR
jgi:hypothetical protein